MAKKESSCLEVKKDGQKIYEIHLEENFEQLPAYLEELGYGNRKICIVTDQNVEKLYGEQLQDILRRISSRVYLYAFPAGEENKNLDTVKDVYTYLIEKKFDRKDLIVAFGGGVAGDLAGFTAATYLRGIDFVQVPTTLLAQVDSSIGGKTGVDFDFYKNMVGAFYQPKLVYMNINSLHTLPAEQFYCGMGEILKHGLIKDAAYYIWVIEHLYEIAEREYETLFKMILKSCKIKRRVVEKDPTEQGDRALLNFGHTIGHAIETLKKGKLLHGQCVALGSVAAAHISWKRGYLSTEEFFEVRDMNVGFELPISVEDIDSEEIIAAARSDKKAEAGNIKFILLKSIGEAYLDTEVTEKEMKEAIDFINADIDSYEDE